MGHPVSRRRALKGAAVVGGALWVSPVIQSIHMPDAWALVASVCGDPVCYSMEFQIDEGGGVTLNPSGPFNCLDPENFWDGPDIFDVTPDGSGGRIVTVGGLGERYPPENTRIPSGFSVGKDGCVAGTHVQDNAMRFPGPGVTDVEVSFCLARHRRVK